VSYAWNLLPDAPAAAPATTTTEALPEASAGLAFLGFGVLRAFQRDQKNDFASGGGMANLNGRLGQILGTKADSTAGPGELPWRSDFGSRLHLLRHKNNNDALPGLARVMILEALGRWEKNILVTGVERLELGTPRRLVLRVHYRLVDQSGGTLVESFVDVPV
jgi:phage baseplate assembly protein W